MKLGGLEGNAAAGEREPLLGPDVDVSIDRDRDPVDAGVDRPPESSPRELLNANVATEPRTKTKTGGARRKVVFDVDETLAEPLGETAPPEAEEDREARAAAAAERAAKKARAARLARAKAAREDAERRLATSTTLKKREDTKNTQTPVGELSREALLERARGALPRRANAAGDTGIPGGA